MDVLTIKEVLKAVRSRAKGAHEALRTGVGLALGGSDAPSAAVLDARARDLPQSSKPPLPVRICSPTEGHFMSTFFDVDAFSPSGRYLALTEVPFIWRLPYPGDTAWVCVVDLHDQSCRRVYETRGWGAQLGANVQWGSDDDTLFFNDVIKGGAKGVALDLRTLQARVLEGPVYGLTPDRRYSFSADLELINAGIPGYGVPEGFWGRKRLRDSASRDEGVWRTDLHSGESELFLSIHDILAAIPEQDHLRGGTNYVFNVKVNPRNDRLMIVLFTRNAPGRPGWPPQLVTCDLSGGNIHLAVPDRIWRNGGHHPNWAPDGDHIVMNLRPPGEAMRFARFRFDGSEMEWLAPGHKGSGHPSLDPTGRFLVTDAYTTDGFTGPDGRVPIRLIDLVTNQEIELARVYTNRILGPRRVDPHPSWSSDGTRLCFNGVVGGQRQVMVVDTSALPS